MNYNNGRTLIEEIMTKSQLLQQKMALNEIASTQQKIEKLEKENKELQLILKDFVEAAKDNERKQDI